MRFVLKIIEVTYNSSRSFDPKLSISKGNIVPVFFDVVIWL